MTSHNSHPNLVVEAQFYEALSGEFETVQDPLVKHSLGRLAHRTYRDGQRSYEIGVGLGSGGEQFRYQLPWAPNIDSFIFCKVPGRIPRLSGITLIDNTDGRAVAFDSDFGAIPDINDPHRNNELTPSELSIYIPGSVLFNRLKLEENPQKAKIKAARRAADFFEEAALLR